MEPQILLYIGGCADGKRKLTHHDRVKIRDYNSDRHLMRQYSDQPIELFFTDHLYRRERICGPSVVLTVMLWDKLTPNDMIEALVTKYPAPLNDD